MTGCTLDDVRKDVFSDDTAVPSCASMLLVAVLHVFVIVENHDFTTPGNVDIPEFGNEVEDNFVLLPVQ